MDFPTPPIRRIYNYFKNAHLPVYSSSPAEYYENRVPYPTLTESPTRVEQWRYKPLGQTEHDIVHVAETSGPEGTPSIYVNLGSSGDDLGILYNGVLTNTDVSPAVPSNINIKTFTASIYAMATFADAYVRIRVEGYNSSLNRTGSISYGDITLLEPNQMKRLFVVADLSSVARYVRIGIEFFSWDPILAQNGRIYAAGASLTNTNTLIPYFDQHRADPSHLTDLTINRVEGVNPYTRLTGVVPSGTLFNSNLRRVKSTFDGKPALRVRGVARGTNSATQSITFQINTADLPISSDYKVVATMHAKDPYEVTRYTQPFPNRHNIFLNSTSFTEPTDGVGSFKHEIRMTEPESNLQLFNGGTYSNREIWWTDLGIFESDYDGPAFNILSGPFQYKGQWVKPVPLHVEGIAYIEFLESDVELYPISWDKVSERFFETGVDRGMLYFDRTNGVPWNGLVSVDKTPEVAGERVVYIDGVRVHNDPGAETLSLDVQSLTYPEALSEAVGEKRVAQGFRAGQQARSEVDFCYRTKLGNDIRGVDLGYKLHLVYNATVVPSSAPASTISDKTTPTTFGWNFSMRDISYSSGFGSYYTLDSREIPLSKMLAIEMVLYGAQGNPPKMPTPQEIEDFLNS